MDFKNWIISEYSEDLSPVRQFLQSLGQHVLSHMEVADGYVRVRFPNFESLLQSPQLRIAASTFHSGPLISDAADKGLAAQKNMLKLVKDPNQGWGQKAFPWIRTPGQQAGDFREAINKIQVLPRPMGLLFELGVYIHLVNFEGLKPVSGDNFNQLKRTQVEHQGEIIGKIANHYKKEMPNIEHADLVKRTSTAIFSMIAVHARDVGKQIAEKTKKFLGCNEGGCCPDQIQFMGGQKGEIRNDPADLIISCSKADKSKGWSLKFGTSTRISVAELNLSNAIGIMAKFAGFRDAPKRAKAISNIDEIFENDPFKETGETVEQRISDYVMEIAQAYENKPDAFVKLLNYLIHSGHNTLPAIRNYIVNPNEIGYSPNFKAYFNIPEGGNEIRPKPGAFVSVRQAGQGIVVLTYNLDSLKDKEGVQIFLMPDYTNPSKRTIEFKVTNLASDVIRKRASDPNAFKSKKSNLPF